MTELLNTPVWLYWCCVAVAAFVVGLGWGLLVNLPEKFRPGKGGGDHDAIKRPIIH